MEIPILVAVLILNVASVVSGDTFADDLDPPQCCWQKEGELCHDNLCCSSWGFCGSTDVYCSEGCQSQCYTTPPPFSPSPPPPSPPPADGGVEALLSFSEFDEMLKNRDNPSCPARGFYTYEGFVAAARTFSEFATTGNISTQKREIAAFLAQTSVETAVDPACGALGIYVMGYCHKIDYWRDPNASYCIENVQWPCATGKSYYGRGPMSLKYNTNYGPAGEALGYDLLNYPNLLLFNEIISCRSALWFWMIPQPPKPSSHDVITENWIPSPANVAAGRLPGYGVITYNIINGDVECGVGFNYYGKSRIGYYKRYCDMLGASYGDNLDCYDHIPFVTEVGLVVNTYMQ